MRQGSQKSLENRKNHEAVHHEVSPGHCGDEAGQRKGSPGHCGDEAGQRKGSPGHRGDEAGQRRARLFDAEEYIAELEVRGIDLAAQGEAVVGAGLIAVDRPEGHQSEVLFLGKGNEHTRIV
jgi:hypothetical protein